MPGTCVRQRTYLLTWYVVNLLAGQCVRAAEGGLHLGQCATPQRGLVSK
jgi:hypothetical protein